MSQVWIPKSKEIIKFWLEELQNAATLERLTPWEQHFISSVDWQFADTGRLSQKQETTLERIYAERTK